jgi:hypothetical protein
MGMYGGSYSAIKMVMYAGPKKSHYNGDVRTYLAIVMVIYGGPYPASLIVTYGHPYLPILMVTYCPYLAIPMVRHRGP